MRKLNLKSYIYKTNVPDPKKLGDTIEAEFPYNFKDSLLNMLFIPDLQLGGAELVKQNVLAIKIEQCKEDEISLEDEEFARVKKALDIFKGFRRADVEFVTRINEAGVAEVKTK